MEEIIDKIQLDNVIADELITENILDKSKLLISQDQLYLSFDNTLTTTGM